MTSTAIPSLPRPGTPPGPRGPGAPSGRGGQPGVLRAPSVDDFLGDRADRYFGEGMQRVTQSLCDLTVQPPTRAGGAGLITATAGLGLPALWSRKGGGHRRPHLSTVDAMVLAARLTGLYAAHTHELTADDALTVRSVTVAAGSSPDEEGLERFPVHAVIEPPAATTGGTTVAACRIGSMAVRVEAGHRRAHRPGTATARYHDPELLPGPWNDAPFGASHQGRHQLLTDVRADVHGQEASAQLDLAAGFRATGPAAGPATAVDLFAAALQLGQVLLYALDGLDRENTHTLWMRRTTLSPAPGTPETGSRLRVRLERPALLRTDDGMWRTARITTARDGMRLTCHVAHLLPRPHEPGA